MRTHALSLRSPPARIVVALAVGALFSAAVAAAPATPAADSGRGAPPASQRLDDVLWREVQNGQGKTLGAVSDILAEMPSGRIVYVAVLPSEFFERPKAVPPGALVMPAEPRAPLRLTISSDRWINAPVLDWDSALVEKNTDKGREIYGYYQQRWQDPAEKPWGLATVARPDSAPEPVRYVSIKKLLLDRVATPAWQQTGFVRDFLVDWSAQRVTHALVSPRFTPLADGSQTWFAIPVPLLAPPVEGDAIQVHSDVAAFRQAPRVADEAAISSGDRTKIFRYPVAPDRPATTDTKEKTHEK